MNAETELATPQLNADLATAEFASNPDQRCACVLVLDTSGSMSGARIEGLQAGLQTLQEDLAKDALAMRRVDLAVVTFGIATQVARNFSNIDRHEMPHLVAGGLSPMAEAVLLAMELLETRKAEYRANGIPYYRPWLFVITDGEPTDLEGVQAQAKASLRDAESKNRLSAYIVGVEEANMEQLKTWSQRPPLKLRGLQFRELFLWLSASSSAVANSQPGTQVALPAPTWGFA